MAESIGLIERAAALLRQQDPFEPEALPHPVAAHPVAAADAGPATPALILDRGRLARYGINLPSSGRSRTVEEFRLVKRNLMTQLSQGGRWLINGRAG